MTKFGVPDAIRTRNNWGIDGTCTRDEGSTDPSVTTTPRSPCSILFFLYNSGLNGDNSGITKQD